MTKISTLAALAAGDYANALVSATPGGIEAQEKAGQAMLVASALMPIEMHPRREDFEAVGFVFGDAHDKIFINATLPAGWTRQETEHNMWSHILDEQGRKRVEIFYKAAFYDRRADARLLHRFKLSMATARLYDDGTHADDEDSYVVLDGETVIRRSAKCKREDYRALARLGDEMAVWLRERLPRFCDPTAYWDETTALEASR